MAKSPEVLPARPTPTVDPPLAATKLRRRWLRFNLRTMLLLVTVLSIWLGVKVNQARRQKEAVDALKELGAIIVYAHQWNPKTFTADKELDVPLWLRRLAGDDFFQSVETVQVSRPINDGDLVQIAALPQITYLNLNNTGRGVTDAGLAHLPRPDRLIKFFAQGTSLTDESIDFLAAADRMDTLVLGGTRVTDEGLRSLSTMTELSILSLDNTDISDAGLAALGELPELRTLGLYRTRVTDAGLVHLTRHKKLASVNLNYTAITDAGLVRLAQHHSLSTVSLANTAISDAGLEHLSELSNLRAVELEGTNVRGPGLRHIAPLVEDWLILKGTAIDDAALLELKAAKRLQCLNLEDTAITDAGLVHLYGLPKLNLICLEGTQVTGKGIAALNKAMPQLGIVTAP